MRRFGSPCGYKETAAHALHALLKAQSSKQNIEPITFNPEIKMRGYIRR